MEASVLVGVIWNADCPARWMLWRVSSLLPASVNCLLQNKLRCKHWWMECLTFSFVQNYNFNLFPANIHNKWHRIVPVIWERRGLVLIKVVDKGEERGLILIKVGIEMVVTVLATDFQSCFVGSWFRCKAQLTFLGWNVNRSVVSGWKFKSPHVILFPWQLVNFEKVTVQPAWVTVLVYLTGTLS